MTTREASEDWSTMSFAQGRRQAEMLDFLKGDARLKGSQLGYRQLYSATTAVFDSSHHKESTANEWLPEAKAKETYRGYLKRVDLHAGLIAESIFDSTATFPPMLFTHDFVRSHSCSINVCFEAFYQNCTATWQRVLGA